MSTSPIPFGPGQITLDEILEQEFLIPRGLTQTMLAEKMGWSN
jgi:plasmid maintenance system antidote protein VapI